LQPAIADWLAAREAPPAWRMAASMRLLHNLREGRAAAARARAACRPTTT
jgi:hypothetical protein